jgi:hypothetical protein
MKNRENHVKKMIEIANKRYSQDEDEMMINEDEKVLNEIDEESE